MSQRVKVWRPTEKQGWIKYEMSVSGDDVQFTEHFRLSHFIVSRDYPELAAEIVLDDMHIARFDLLSRILLQPARDYIQSPIYISSGMRSPKLNDAVDGSEGSDHLCGLAVDIDTESAVNTQLVFNYLLKHRMDVIGQLILYRDSNGEVDFIHVSLPSERYHGEVLYVTQ